MISTINALFTNGHYIAQTTYQWHKMHKTIPAGRPIVSGSGGPKERSHVETQTMQTADCRLQTADCADRADCADCAD